MNRTKKSPVIILAICALVVTLMLTSCSKAEQKTDRVDYSIDFPANEVGRAEYNEHIFSTEFTLTLTLPRGITIDAGKPAEEGIVVTFSNIPILNDKGDTVGCIGYNVYDAELIRGLPEDEIDPMMIYNQISLGNHYQFAVKNKYDVVNNTEDLQTAISEVHNDVNLSQEERGNYSAEDYNYGIVSYCKTLPVYVALDLDKEAFTQEQIVDIAGSISFDVSKGLEKCS